MEAALDAAGKRITIDQMRERDVMPDLWCFGKAPDGTECGAKVWVTALNSTKRSAAFAAHHIEGCTEGALLSKSSPGGSGHAYLRGAPSVLWRMRLGPAEPLAGPGDLMQPGARHFSHQSRRFATDLNASHGDQANERAFSSLLANLIADTLPPVLEIAIGLLPPVPASQVLARAQDATAAVWRDRKLILWGKVNGYRPTSFRGIILQLEHAAGRLGILVDEKNLVHLQIANPETLVGRHVIAYGSVQESGGSRLPYLKAELYSLAFNPRLVSRSR